MKNELKHRINILIQFLIFGVLLGLIENLIAISFATEHSIDLRVLVISFFVVVPFAAIGELIVDKTNLLPKTKNPWLKHAEVFLEFLIFGVVMGTIEDLIVVGLVTGEPITLEIIGIVTLVTTPFAMIGELIVDRCDWHICKG